MGPKKYSGVTMVSIKNLKSMEDCGQHRILVNQAVVQLLVAWSNDIDGT